MQPKDQPWQTVLPSVTQRISYLRASEKLADITVNFPKHEKSIKAHKFLLALSSPVFEAMFFGPLAEGEVVSLPDDPPEAFEWLLDQLYCKQRKLPNMELTIEVLKLAHKYQIPELFCSCSEYLCKQVDVKNLLLLYSIAYILQDNTLLEHCEKILPTESDKILQSNEVSKLSLSTLKHLLENKKLKPSSVLIVIKCIHTWGKTEFGRLTASLSDEEGRIEAAEQSVKEGDMSSSPHSLRQCVETLLPLVNFSSLSVDEFVEHVLPTGIFTPEENMSILQGLKGVPGTVLPSCVSPWTLEFIVLLNREAYGSNHQRHESNFTFGIYTSHSAFGSIHQRRKSNALFGTSTSHPPYGSNNKRHKSKVLFRINTSHPIILQEIEVHFSKSYPERESFSCYYGDKFVGPVIFSNNRCIFQKPINLEAGREFTFKTTESMYFHNLSSIDAESGGIRITGESLDTVEEIFLKHLVLKK